MVYFGEFLKTWSKRSNSVTRQVNFNRTKIGGKCQNYKNWNATIWVIFKQCALTGYSKNFGRFFFKTCWNALNYVNEINLHCGFSGVPREDTSRRYHNERSFGGRQVGKGRSHGNEIGLCPRCQKFGRIHKCTEKQNIFGAKIQSWKCLNFRALKFNVWNVLIFAPKLHDLIIKKIFLAPKFKFY